ncbi:MAG: DUF1538 domain-containing protein [Gammaproteobacteria bacterium]|nr:DUF1538 domain-containing protein [Gammaproteobacteria bacterium]
MQRPIANSQRFELGPRETLAILWPYVRDQFMEQLKGIWFIVVYLFLFQILVLGLPIAYAGMIAAGTLVVILGLMFFMEGLRLGLMPLGEVIGVMLPRKSRIPVILAFAFILGIGATLAEPAIAVLKAAGAGVKPAEAPLLYSLLNDYARQLVAAVGVGVGIAVTLGVLRFLRGWSLKYLILPLVGTLLGFTLWANGHPQMRHVLGLAWDCGAVTTGPVTVPLVLALGIGVCRMVGGSENRNAGFGIVTLASLFPILAVLLLGLYHLNAEDYYGAAADPFVRAQSASVEPRRVESEVLAFGDAEFQTYLSSGELPPRSKLILRQGEPRLVEGRIVHSDPVIVLEKVALDDQILFAGDLWDPQSSLHQQVMDALWSALRAIVPLCLFLLFTLRVVLQEKLIHGQEVFIGLGFAVVGMSLFGLGITLGLTPLGTQLGSNVPATFTTVFPWGLPGTEGPLFDHAFYGKLVAVIFGFFLGYGATLAEPALNALGNTVDSITAGAFRKTLLMHSVALGVGLGIAAGVYKIAYDLPLAYLVVPPYLLLLGLTWISSEEFVNFSWDSAGVTTGPITVPLVLAMGLGIGGNVPGVVDGFGVLALASVGPVITVLTVGRIVARNERRTAPQE